METKNFLPLVVFTLLTLAAQSSGSTIVYTINSTGISNQYSGDAALGTYNGELYQQADAPAFYGDFSSSQTLQISVLAPAGERFVFNPTFSASYNFEMVMNATDANWFSGDIPTSISMDFLGTNGTVPLYTPNLGDAIFQAGTNNFSINASILGITQPFSFTGVTLTIGIPNTFTTNFTNFSLYGTIVDFYTSGAGVVSPDVPLTLQSDLIPEPSAWILLACGLAVLAAFRRKGWVA